MKTERSDVRATLAQALEDFWEGYAGVRPEYARVVVGDEAVAVWLSGVLSPGKRQLAGTQTGREMLEEVGERILDQAKSQLLGLVEESLAREATRSTSISMSSTATWLDSSHSNEDLDDAS